MKVLPTIHSWIEFFESGARSKLPHIPFFIPVRQYTLDDPWKSKVPSLTPHLTPFGIRSYHVDNADEEPEYDQAQSDLIGLTQVTTSHPVYITSNPTTAQYISQKSTIFDKPVDMFRYKAINIFGKQIVSVHNGEEHRRHKGVVRGCFGGGVMQSAWEGIVGAWEVLKVAEGISGGGVVKDVKGVMIKVCRVCT